MVRREGKNEENREPWGAQGLSDIMPSTSGQQKTSQGPIIGCSFGDLVKGCRS